MTLELGADGEGFPDLEPGIFLSLLETKGNPLVVAVDVENHHLDFVAFVDHFRRMLHPLGPGHVGDVDQAIDTGLDFDEGAEAGQVANLARDASVHRVLEGQHHPRILFCLLHPQGDLLLALVHLEHHRLDGLADADHLRGVPHVTRPAHLGDVDQALDAGLELDEGAVVGDRHHLALHPASHRVFLGDALPWVVLQLLHAEADALALPVDVEDLDLEFLADLHHLARVGHPAIRHVGDVQQAVDTTQVDEGTEVGDVFDHAGPHLTVLQFLHQVLALAGPLGLQDDPAAHHDVPAALVELDDLELVGLPQQLVDVGDPAQGDLASREERVDAHQVDDHSTLDLLDQRPFDRLVALVGLADLLPHPHEVGLLLGQYHRPVLIFQVLEEDFDLITFLEFAGIGKLLERDRALGLEAQVEDDRIVGHAENLRRDDLALGDRGHGALVHRQHLLVLFVAVRFVVEIRSHAEDRLVGQIFDGLLRSFGGGISHGGGRQSLQTAGRHAPTGSEVHTPQEPKCPSGVA